MTLDALVSIYVCVCACALPYTPRIAPVGTEAGDGMGVGGQWVRVRML